LEAPLSGLRASKEANPTVLLNSIRWHLSGLNDAVSLKAFFDWLQAPPTNPPKLDLQAVSLKNLVKSLLFGPGGDPGALFGRNKPFS
jgi:hypothetical protein